METQRLYERWREAFQKGDQKKRLQYEDEILRTLNGKIEGAAIATAVNCHFRSIDARDIAQWARLQLLQSLHRYESDKALFLVYAKAVIDGAITAFVAEEYHKASCRLLDVRTTEQLNRLQEELQVQDSISSLIDRLGINQAVEKLPERHGIVLRKRYWLKQTQDQVAADMNLSQPMISRLEAEAIEMLRTALMGE